jgi:hypothetical protein
MSINPNSRRFLLILLAGISLLTGLWAGIARMGWLLPVPNSQFVVIHGPLMVVGFLGTLIGLERAVALQRWWAYGIPVLSGLSALAGLAGGPSGTNRVIGRGREHAHGCGVPHALSSIPFRAFHHYGAERRYLVGWQCTLV